MNAVYNKSVFRFRTNILIGLFILAPLVGTFLIINLILAFISNRLVPSGWLTSEYAILYRIAALIVVVAALYFVGLLTRNFIGQKIYRFADWILTRILWLSGCEAGKNKGGNVDSYDRYIYIHGGPDDLAMGVPGSRGCVRMRNEDMIELFDLVETETSVNIIEK